MISSYFRRKRERESAKFKIGDNVSVPKFSIINCHVANIRHADRGASNCEYNVNGNWFEEYWVEAYK